MPPNSDLLKKVIWSFGKRPEIFWENSHLFDFHLKAPSPTGMHSYMKIILLEFEVKTWS